MKTFCLMAMKFDFTSDIAIALISGLISFVVYFIRGRSEYNKASKYINMDIAGIWYSAELDFKQSQVSNAYTKVELKRKKLLGNKITIKVLEQINQNPNLYNTAWLFNGKLWPDNTVYGNYVGLNNHSLGSGQGFIKFIGNGRAVGYWVGYSGKYHGQPMYGYWVLSRNEKDVHDTAQFLLEHFQYFDVKYLVEHKSELILPKDYIIKN